MGDMRLGLSVDSLSNFLTLAVDYGYKETEVIDRADMRTKAGGLYTYLSGGSFKEIKLPASWVSSADRLNVNSWWRSGATVRLYPDDVNTANYFDCRIMENEEPLNRFVKPYFQQFYRGQIVLETI